MNPKWRVCLNPCHFHLERRGLGFFFIIFSFWLLFHMGIVWGVFLNGRRFFRKRIIRHQGNMVEEQKKMYAKYATPWEDDPPSFFASEVSS
jgi:hypothetical protein